ncbi:hypothetical protein PHLCEN_2v7929 [Hermanssonia centrifuga]|uniref:Uncharacterized protein n=1 Tax=Hermanssonia centrifuga TaxID=98765 RepID=A0A2R6NVB4_9APHY|nr:hypothetical protein PHLCEN_2v7929 [Hermanssonia centrifuga]
MAQTKKASVLSSESMKTHKAVRMDAEKVAANVSVPTAPVGTLVAPVEDPGPMSEGSNNANELTTVNNAVTTSHTSPSTIAPSAMPVMPTTVTSATLSTTSPADTVGLGDEDTIAGTQRGAGQGRTVSTPTRPTTPSITLDVGDPSVALRMAISTPRTPPRATNVLMSPWSTPSTLSPTTAPSLTTPSPSSSLVTPITPTSLTSSTAGHSQSSPSVPDTSVPETLAPVVEALPLVPQTLAEQMVAFQEVLLHGLDHNEFYLGDPSFNPRAMLTWIMWDSTNILASVEEADRFRHETEVYNHDPENISEPDLPRAADLIAVFRMDPTFYYLTADGNWQETGPYASPFDECKATFLGSEPADDLFALNFPNVENNMRIIVDMARSPTRPPLKGLYQNLNDGRTLQKFCHKMFEALEANETVPALPHHEYTIAGWPARNLNAQRALDKMAETHRVNILPTFDQDGDPIRPSFYAQRMKGCDARIHFSLSHWPISESKTSRSRASDTIVCDMQNIQVLVRPPPRKGQKGKRNWERDVFTPLGSPSPKKMRGL